MSMNMFRKQVLWAVALCLALVCASPVWAVNGAIQTTFPNGTMVNGNLYPSKDQVYLVGGPQNMNSSGLSPDNTTYYFQVTNPSGSVLLSLDDISCRQVQVTGGKIVGSTGPTCKHANASMNLANGEVPVQLCNPTNCTADFADTPNGGGEYKVWVTPASEYGTCTGSFGFCGGDTKTDNFKIMLANAASVVACKFSDLNDNGVYDLATEPLLSGWTINATGVDAGQDTATGQDGCVTYTITNFPNAGTQTVTLAEVQQQGYMQTAPANGSCGSKCSVAGGTTYIALSGATVTQNATITITVKPGDSVTAPLFGNFQFSAEVNLSVTKDSDPSYTAQWGIAKSVVGNTTIDTSGSATANYSVAVTLTGEKNIQDGGTITISNANPFAVTGVNVTDADNLGGSCKLTDANAGLNETVPAATPGGPNGTLMLPYVCTYSTLPTTTGTDIATASYSLDGGATTTQSSTPPVTVDFSTASITNATVNVTDSLAGSLGSVTVHPGLPAPTLTTTGSSVSVSGNVATFTYSTTFSSDPAGTCTSHDNTATFTATDDSTVTGSDKKTVKVCVGADLTVSKTAVATLSSAISKSVNKTTVQQSGGTITFNYTVTVTESLWQVAGNITVKNPNDWEAITANVTDVLTDAGGSCSVTGGIGVSVPASMSVVLPYTCTFASRPSAVSGPTATTGNTATATWDKAAAFTPDGSNLGTAGYTFPTLTITDNVQSSANPTGCTPNPTLGTVSVTTTTPNPTPGCGITSLASSTWGVFTYSITDNNSAPGTCASYNNTAQITGGSSSGQITVTVCNTNTGALTIGFWKNTNGQKIISGYCGGTSGTSLMKYLAGISPLGFNPFRDDTATTCAAEATYVANIISGATCSTSGTCNTMLRAQMLATALDVYFSDPSLGGNRIGSFNGLGSNQPSLGGVAINLSHICSMADGSTGAACSGTYEDARPEFGIAPPCLGTTIGQMLAYSNASSATNGNPVATANTGASWYLQNKGRQVYAKDGFDNINNTIASIAPTSCSPSF